MWQQARQTGWLVRKNAYKCSDHQEVYRLLLILCAAHSVWEIKWSCTGHSSRDGSHSTLHSNQMTVLQYVTSDVHAVPSERLEVYQWLHGPPDILSNLFSQCPSSCYSFRLVSCYQLNAQFLYSITIYMLHYNPQHVSSSTLLIFRRTDCIITASGIVTLCKQPYSMPVESGLQSTLDRHTVQTAKIPDAVIIQFVLLKMNKVLLEICWGL